MNVFSCGKWGSIHNVDDSDHFYVDQAQHKKIPRKWTSTLSDLNEDQLSQYQHPNSLQRCVSAHQNNVKQLMPRQCIKILNQINPSAYHQIPVVIIHPLEGHVNMCRNLANLLKYPVIGVQYSKEAMKYESIRELAQYYWKQIQSHFGCNKRVHLCGYGFGAMVALEMADLKVNRCASLILLDSGKPCVSNYIMMATSNMKNKAKIENEALFGFACTYIQPVSKFELMGAIMECNTLAQRINLVVNLLMEKSQFKFDRADLKDAACSYVIKCMMSEDLMPVCALRFPEVILIKASNQETELEDLIRIKKSKNVMGHCNVETHIIGCDVRSMLDGQNCKHVADIMNENLIRFI
jgi:pimeloyl-ACP methyl ester carboxylesterase